MSKITDFLDAAAAAYYAGSPFIDDDVFDKLAESAGYQKVGARQGEVKHFKQMFSLQKYYEDEGAPPLPGKRVVRTPKLDGAAIELVYIDGKLTSAATRGDGLVGQDITDKLLARPDLAPASIDTKSPVLQFTGEICAPSNIENARNYAAGALNLKDIGEFKTRAISFFCYGVWPYQSETFTNDMRFAKSCGFNTVFEEAIEKIYPCDGIVARIDNNDEFEAQGYTAKFPKGSYAIKERQEAVETTLLAVEWTTGRTGKVTPVAILEPVMIGDAEVSRATLNNPGFIEALGLCIGDRVAIVRSGMIVPKILHKVDA